MIFTNAIVILYIDDNDNKNDDGYQYVETINKQQVKQIELFFFENIITEIMII